MNRKQLAIRLYEWHDGQNDPIYKLSSGLFAGAPPTRELVNDCVKAFKKLSAYELRNGRRCEADDLEFLAGEVAAL